MKRTTKFKKIMAVVLCMMMVISTFTIVPMTASAVSVEAPETADEWDGTIVEPEGKPDGEGEKGSKTNPYQIKTCENYMWMKDAAALKTHKIYEEDGETVKQVVIDQDGFRSKMVYFELAADLNFDGNKQLTGVAAGTDGEWATISLDGKGYTIYNMDTVWGLFDRIGRDTTTGEPAVIKDLNLVAFTASRAGNASALALNTDGLVIENVTIDSTSEISSTGALAGGFVANVRSSTLTIRNCTNEADVTSATAGAAGFVAAPHTNSTATAITLENCVNKGDVTAATYASGVYGYRDKAIEITLQGCVNYGTISSTKTESSANYADAVGVAGIFAYTFGSSGALTINDCVNYGTVYGSDTFTAGIIGHIRSINAATVISNCANHGSIQKKNGTYAYTIGGIVGLAHYSYGETLVIENNVNTADLTNSSYVGGIVGWISEYVDASVAVDGCINTGIIQTKDTAGGIVGKTEISVVTFEDCANDADIISTGSHAGGIVGRMEKCGQSATITNKDCTLTGCINNGNLSSNNSVGGMIGQSNGGVTFILADCVNTGTLSSPTYAAGGMIGYISSSAAGYKYTFTSSVNTGTVKAKHAGGVVGLFVPNVNHQPAYHEDEKDNAIVFVFTNVANLGDITGTHHIGGMMGKCDRTNVSYNLRYKLESCYNVGNITATDASGYAGGFFGDQRVYSSTNAAGVGVDLIHCYSVANISVPSTSSNATAFFGDTTDDETANTMKNSYGACIGTKRPATYRFNLTSEKNDYYENSGDLASKTTEFTLDGGPTTIAAEMEAINLNISAIASVPSLNIAQDSQNLMVRLKMTAPFGFMVITTLKNEDDGETVPYHNGVYTLKFAFLASADEITDANAIINAKDATTVETSAYYQDFATMQSAEFEGLTAPQMDQDIYFVCYLENYLGERVATSTVRSINPYEMVKDASNGYLFDTNSAEGVKIPNEKEVALYQKIVAYCDAYNVYDNLTN